MRRHRAVLAIAAITIAFIGCTGSAGSKDAVLVSVASSLTDQFTQIEIDVENRYPEIDIDLNIAGSTTLLSQIDAGAAVDIVALADETSANSLSVAVVERSGLASNWLVVLHGSDKPVFSLTDLIEEDLIISACDPSVPCGRLTQQALVGESAPVVIDSLETNVRVVRDRVTSGEADVGFVYATDAVDLPSDVTVAPIDLMAYRNNSVAALLTEREPARVVYDFVLEYFADLAPQEE